jgi:hypothetical protein
MCHAFVRRYLSDNDWNTIILPNLKNINYCLIRPERMKRMWEVRGNKIPDESERNSSKNQFLI